MGRFDEQLETWMEGEIAREHNPLRLERLEKGLGHGTIEFLRRVWFPAVGHFHDLHLEWEVRDFGNGYRYLDLAYMPAGAKGGIEIQGYGPHARDLDVRRFKDLCLRQCLLSLDGAAGLWGMLPVIVATPPAPLLRRQRKFFLWTHLNQRILVILHSDSFSFSSVALKWLFTYIPF
ncbi:hypothetical protein [Paenibacillus lycopersici]|uniref:hypothetical protein n=1 Tax=Paenibacillus lycopersici TaxID=2704462 RepID=UPI001CDB86EB|nr:hypothetical protein [Paenibacillus lycopersici]